MRTTQEKVFYYTSKVYHQKWEQMATTMDKVAFLLNDIEHLRNCDKCLIRVYHRKADNYHGEIDQDIIHGLTPEESITRARRQIQAMGMFLPTDEGILKARRLCELAVKDWSINERGESAL